ncbi:MAG: chemotaxis protein CheW [Planctomycetales bacterium]|nr:chemotaxis protein CheW [Planctomycetales bacterium]
MNALSDTQADAALTDTVEELTGFASDGNQYLTFRLLDEEYGVEILRVQEIKNLSHITPIPNTPSFIKGAMNLRGTVVPIIDLRTKFSMPPGEYNQYTVIIVVTIGTRVMGLVVDAVSDVLNVGSEDYEPAPSFGGDVDTSFMTGLAKSGDRLITLLNIDKLVGLADISQSN